MRERWRRSVRWLFIAVALVGVVLLGAVRSTIHSGASTDQRCASTCANARPACLGGLAPSSLTLELAGSGERLSCHLRLRSPASAADTPDEQERICIEARIQTWWDELVTLDAGVLIPQYVLLSLLLAVWVALDASPRRRRVAMWAAAAVIATSLALAGLDGRENRYAQNLLIAAQASGALDPRHLSGLDAPALMARNASLAKWLASAPWALSIAWCAWVSRRTRQRADYVLGVGAACAALIGSFTFAAAVLLLVGAQIEWGSAIMLLQTAFALVFAALPAIVLAVAASRIPRFDEALDQSSTFEPGAVASARSTTARFSGDAKVSMKS